MIGILVATLLIDKHNTNNSFQNEAKWANGGYYLIAALILMAVVWLYSKTRKQRQDASMKLYIICILAITLFTVVIQVIVSMWAPEIIGRYGDFASPATAAVDLANGTDLSDVGYLQKHPNNVNLTIMLSFLYRICRSWRMVIIVSSFFTTISVLLMTYVTRKITGSRYTALFINVLGHGLISLAWRAFIPYSDILAMPFIIGMFAILYSGLSNRLKAPLIALSGMIAAWIKITAVIPLIAIVLYYLIAKHPFHAFKQIIKQLKEKKFSSARPTILSIFLVLLVIGGGLFTGRILKRYYHYSPGDNARGWQYMFMVGQNNKNTGQTGGGGEHGKQWKKITKKYSTRDEQMKACVDAALTWIKDRGIIGNIVFYTKALNVAYNDGSFHHVQPYQPEEVEHNFIYEFYYNEGKYHTTMAGVRQVLWDMVLILLAVPLVMTLFKKKRNLLYLVFEMCILGITLYLFIFEGRSKYLFMYLPVYLAFAALLMGDSLKLLTKKSTGTGEEADSREIPQDMPDSETEPAGSNEPNETKKNNDPEVQDEQNDPDDQTEQTEQKE